MSKMVEKGILGRKVGKGFYLYPKDAKKGSKEKALNPEVRHTFSSNSATFSYSFSTISFPYSSSLSQCYCFYCFCCTRVDT